MLDTPSVDQMIFNFDDQESKYFQLKVTNMEIMHTQHYIVQIVDVSNSVLYVVEKE